MSDPLGKWIERSGAGGPWFFLALFLAASGVMIWRLEKLSAAGWAGTVLGTLIMPYCSGLGNLIFTGVVLARHGGDSADVMTNCLVNNVTDVTLVLGLPAVFWSMDLFPSQRTGGVTAPVRPAIVGQTDRRALMVTLTALILFTAVTWAAGTAGRIGRGGGVALLALFAAWQGLHVVEVIRGNVRNTPSLDRRLLVNLLLLAVGAWYVYVSTDGLVDWVSKIQTGFISVKYLGWLSGWLMVLPNGAMAIYYAWTRRPDIFFSSQIGDSHICIPLCVGIFAVFKPVALPPIFNVSIVILLAAGLAHVLFIGLMGRLPRLAGLGLTAAYGFFLLEGLLK